MQLNNTVLVKTTFLFFAMFAIHISLYSPLGTGLYLAYNSLTWLTMSILIGLGFWNLSKTKTFNFTPLIYFIAVGSILLFIPMFYANANLLSALPRFIGFLGGVLLFISLYQLKLNAKAKLDILFILLLGITIESSLGLLQLFLNDLLVMLAGTNYELLNNRPSGVFRQPNVMASFMATGIVLSLLLNFYKPEQGYDLKRTFLIRYSIFSCALVLVTLQSKTGYLGAIIGLALFTPIFIKKFSTYKSVLSLLCIGFLAGILSFNSIQGIEGIEGSSRGEKLYSDGGVRTDIIKTSYNMYKEAPLVGHGYGKFERSYLETHHKQMALDPELKSPVTNLDHPHNEYLLWATEGGLIAFLGLIVLSLGGLLIFKGKVKLEKLALFSLCIPILLHTQTEKPFYLSAVHWLYFISLLWFIDGKLNHLVSYNVKSYLLAKLTAVIVPILVIPFMISTIHTSLKVSSFIASDYKKTEYLSDIVNHIAWQGYFEEFYNNTKFYDAVSKDNFKHLNEYIAWSYEYLQTTPRSHLYENLILSIVILEKNDYEINLAFKNKVYAEANTLYPTRDVWGDEEGLNKLQDASK